MQLSTCNLKGPRKSAPPYRITSYNVCYTKLLRIKSEDGTIRVAFADPLDKEAVQAAGRSLGKTVVPIIAQERSIKKTLELLADKKSGKSLTVDNSTVVGTVNSIILAAIKNNASDIHIEPMVV